MSVAAPPKPRSAEPSRAEQSRAGDARAVDVQAVVLETVGLIMVDPEVKASAVPDGMVAAPKRAPLPMVRVVAVMVPPLRTGVPALPVNVIAPDVTVKPPVNTKLPPALVRVVAPAQQTAHNDKARREQRLTQHKRTVACAKHGKAQTGGSGGAGNGDGCSAGDRQSRGSTERNARQSDGSASTEVQSLHANRTKRRV